MRKSKLKISKLVNSSKLRENEEIVISYNGGQENLSSQKSLKNIYKIF